MKQSCGSFAKSVLENCPTDVEQRIADGLGYVLAPFNDNCGAFSFQAMLNAEDPTAQLPVVFSSRNYKSPIVEPTDAQFPTMSETLEDVWFGVPPNIIFSTWCCKTRTSTGVAKFYYLNNNAWTQRGAFRSTETMAVFTDGSHIRKFPINIIIGYNITASDYAISSDGAQIYALDPQGLWLRYGAGGSWNALNFKPNAKLCLSFDGLNACAVSNQQLEYLFDGVYRSVPIASGNTYACMLGSLVFFVQGADLYTVGTLKVVVKLKTFDAACTGIWSDDVAVYVDVDRTTHMSIDRGWTWVTQPGKSAIAPGVYKDGSNRIWMSSLNSFQIDVGLPLRLNNSGLLYSPAWRNWYQFMDLDIEYTHIDEGPTTVVSPNGRYLIIIGDDVTVYLNVWNLPSFWTWCRFSGAACMDGYKGYCQLTGIPMENCMPGFSPDPPPDPPDPPDDDDDDDVPAKPSDSNMLWVWIGVGLFIVVLIVVIILAFKLKKSRQLYVSSSIS